MIERNQNNTRVFQGLPLVRSIDEAEKKISPLGLPEKKKKQWLAVLQALFNARQDEGMSADELAELPEFRANGGDSSAPRTIAGDTQTIMRILHEMTEVGLIKKGILLNAFVRYKVSDHSRLRFDKVCTLERVMLKLMQELEPDAEGWLNLSLRHLNQRLVDEGHAVSPGAIAQSLEESIHGWQRVGGEPRQS